MTRARPRSSCSCPSSRTTSPPTACWNAARLEATYRGTSVLTTPPPSLGGTVVRDALELIDADDDIESRPRALALAYGGNGSSPKLTGTTHVSVLDEAGNAAALSMTLGAGSGVFRHGFQLNNMLGELDVIGGGPHAVGERLPSMMTPTVVRDGRRPRLVLGSAGSVRLAGAIVQVICRAVDGASVEQAIDAPRIHPDGQTLHVEGGWPDDVVSRWARDWRIVPWAGRNLFFGGVSAVEARPDGSLAAGGDPRRGGAGAVVP